MINCLGVFFCVLEKLAGKNGLFMRENIKSWLWSKHFAVNVSF